MREIVSLIEPRIGSLDYLTLVVWGKILVTLSMREILSVCWRVILRTKLRSRVEVIISISLDQVRLARHWQMILVLQRSKIMAVHLRMDSGITLKIILEPRMRIHL
jgi:hypothetical protein